MHVSLVAYLFLITPLQDGHEVRMEDAREGSFLIN